MRSLRHARSAPFPALLTLVTLLALTAVGASASVAAAALYEVEVCTPNAPDGNGLQHAFEEPADPEITHSHDQIFFKGCGDDGLARIQQGTTPGTALKEGGVTWALFAPVNTRFNTLKVDQSFSRPGAVSFLDFFFGTERGFVIHYRDDGNRALPPSGPATFENLSSTSLSGVLTCLTTAPCTGGEFVINYENFVVLLEDNFPPEVAEPVVPAGAVRGVTNVSYSASDPGSGVADAALVVDGVEQPSVHDSNDGRCSSPPPYQFLEPCRLRVRSSLPLDTTQLADGAHEVRVAVVDAAGQRTESTPVTLTVHNVPTNTTRPIITGRATVGEQLTTTTGAWDGDPTAFTYQWLRCPPAVVAPGDTTGCLPIDGATSPQYATTDADAQQRDLAQVTAVNASGVESVFSGPSELIVLPVQPPPPPPRPSKNPPVLTHVSLSRKSFRIAKIPTAPGAGTLLRFSSSKAGHLTIVIDRAHGKRSKHVATLVATIKAGRSAVALNGTVGTKLLPPGHYKVTITVRDAAKNPSRPVSLPFTILPG